MFPGMLRRDISRRFIIIIIIIHHYQMLNVSAVDRAILQISHANIVAKV